MQQGGVRLAPNPIRRSLHLQRGANLANQLHLTVRRFAAHPHFTVRELGEVPASTLDVHPIGIDPLFLTLVPLLAFPLNYQSQCHLHTHRLSANIFTSVANTLTGSSRKTSSLSWRRWMACMERRGPLSMGDSCSRLATRKLLGVPA